MIIKHIKGGVYMGGKRSSKEIFIKILEKYNSDNPELVQQAKEEAINQLEKLMHSIINIYFYNYAAEYTPELMQEGALGILKGLKKYNPDLAAPSTYFYWHIKHQMQIFVDEMINGISEYYSVNIKKIKVAIKEINDYNMEYSEVKIAELTKLPLKTVKHSLEILFYSNQLKYDAFPDYYKSILIPAESESVENVFVQKESIKITETLISELLNKQEEFVIRYMFGLNSSKICLKSKDIANILNVPPAKIRRVYNSAIKKLKNSELLDFYIE